MPTRPGVAGASGIVADDCVNLVPNPAVMHEDFMMLEVRFIDVSSATVRRTVFARANRQDTNAADALARTLSTLQDDLVNSLQRAYSPQGIIVKNVADKKYLINLGAADGLEKGDKIQLFVEDTTILDPATGKPLRGAHQVIGDGAIIELQAESAIIKLSHLSGTLEEGKTTIEPKP